MATGGSGQYPWMRAQARVLEKLLLGKSVKSVAASDDGSLLIVLTDGKEDHTLRITDDSMPGADLGMYPIFIVEFDGHRVLHS